jgi:hypothetical protein
MVYITLSSVEQLHPHVCLALINRYSKLKDEFYYADIDVLYAIKESKIGEWVSSGQMIATKVIKRVNPTFEAMQKTIALGGDGLEVWYSRYFDYDRFIPEDVLPMHRLLLDIVNDDICLPRDELLYSSEFAEYEEQLAIYNAEMERRKPIQSEYDKIYASWCNNRFASLCEWAKQKKLNIPVKGVKKRKFIEHAYRQGFSYPPFNVVKPNFDKIVCPKVPKKEEELSLNDYQIGMNPEVDEAIAWMKSFALETGFAIDDDFKCWDSRVTDFIEDYYREVDKEETIELVLEIMRSALDGKLTAKEVWDGLTDFEIDYESAIGMRCEYKRHYNEEKHRDFGKWHEINLSMSGYWLVEFQSTIDTTLVFHLPYENVLLKKCFALANLNQLPVEHSLQEHYGREISSEERAHYPLLPLLSVFGYDESDFPYELARYVSNRHYYYDNHDWDEDDCDDEIY